VHGQELLHRDEEQARAGIGIRGGLEQARERALLGQHDLRPSTPSSSSSMVASLI